MADAPPRHDASGHRRRLRERLLNSGSGALSDHELIEYLLTLAIRRGDTKATAKALLREFGSIGRVLTAKPVDLMRVAGVGEIAAATLKIAQATAIALLREQAVSQPVLASWQALIDYLHASMAHIEIEQVRVLYLDAKNALMRDEIVSEGTIDQAAVYTREIMKRALALGATNLILVHNHPTGDPQPSRADIQLTREIMEAGKRLSVAVHDHIIMGARGHTSLRSQGLM